MMDMPIDNIVIAAKALCMFMTPRYVKTIIIKTNNYVA